MWPTLVMFAFVVLVLVLAWRGRDSPNQPRTCCSAKQWPPDDLTGAASAERGLRDDSVR